MDPVLKQLFDAETHLFNQALSPDAAAEDGLRYLLPLYQRKSKFKKDIATAVSEMTGYGYLQSGKPLKAAQCFEEARNYYQTGLCYLVAKDLDSTHRTWSHVIEAHPFHWCITVWGTIHHQLESYPSFFQIRNHLEASIGQFFRYKRGDLANCLIDYADTMAQINLETYKYIGRALLNFEKDIPRAEHYLLKNQKILPNDPEVYYHLAQAKHLMGQDEDALILLAQCTTINYAYTPATDLKNRILKN